MKTFNLDISDKENLKNILEKIKPNYIFNLVGLVGEYDFETLYRINVDVSRHILDWSISSGKQIIKRILLIGSSAEYGIPYKNPVSEEALLAPVNFYGLSKLLQSELAFMYVRRFSAPVLIGRTFNIKGEGQSKNLAIGSWEEKILEAQNGGSISVGNIETWRDYISIDEALDAYIKILFHGEIGEVYNVCTGIPVQMKTLLKDMIKRSGKDLKIKVSEELKKKRDVKIIYGDRRKLEKILEKSNSKSQS